MRLQILRLVTAVVFVALLFSIMPFSLAKAEEGMFMLDKISSLPLAKKGLKINPNEIYSPDGNGLAQAVVRLSIGCSAEFVSPEGLVLTNHHCGYDALVAASTAQNNYGESGFKASSRAEELPAKGYSLDITLKEEDVTSKVLSGIDQTDAEAVQKRISTLENEEKTRVGENIRVQIQPLNNGLFYYLFNYQTIKDVRIVYAPPKNIGFYGGDPDNFEWTRHCGDFTFMRAYVAPDGKAAEYSANNVPFKPRKFLSVALDAVKENDLTMIIGYPGGTTRYRESYSVAFNQDVRLPFLVDFLRADIEALQMVSRNDENKRVALQARIFELNNSLKAFEGGVVAMQRANLVAQKQTDEAKLKEWIAQDAKRARYNDAIVNLKTTYDNYLKHARKDLVLQFMPRIEPVGLAFGLLSGQITKANAPQAVTEVAQTEPAVNRQMLVFMLRKAAELPSDQKIAAVEKRFGSLSGEARRRAEDEFARQALESQSLTTESGLNKLIDLPIEQLRSSNEPLLQFVSDLLPEFIQSVPSTQQFNAAVGKYRLPYQQAMNEMKNATPYPDANFTQRFSYGNVKGYSPRESISYSPFTTLNGVFEKDTGREPFNAPAKLRTLWQRKDFGSYNVNGTVPVNFLTTNDIIGGNSGSPVLNARGEQIGIAFDGNYEGLGNDFFFSNALGRTIVVDIRYVLFLTEKFGEVSWILKEMNFKGGNAKAATGKR